MATVELKCPVPGCDMGEGVPYKTEKVEKDMAWGLMQMHSTAAHPTTAQQSGTAREGRPQAERVKRPILTLTGQSISQEDYDHFLYQFGLYKERLGPGHDSATLLRECLAEDVSKMLYSCHGVKLTKFTEQQLSLNIIASCVTKQTDQARTTELHRIKQDPGQPVQSFLATLKSKSRQCNMRMLCSRPTCEQVNDYSERVVLSLFIGGISDMELQQDLLAEQDITLSKLSPWRLHARLPRGRRRSWMAASKWPPGSPPTRRA